MEAEYEKWTSVSLDNRKFGIYNGRRGMPCAVGQTLCTVGELPLLDVYGSDECLRNKLDWRECRSRLRRLQLQRPRVTAVYKHYFYGGTHSRRHQGSVRCACGCRARSWAWHTESLVFVQHFTPAWLFACLFSTVTTWCAPPTGGGALSNAVLRPSVRPCLSVTCR